MLTSFGPNFAQDPHQRFSNELQVLKDGFHILCMAALIKKDGQVIFREYMEEADLTSAGRVDSTALFHIASITKVFPSNGKCS